ncbi:MAG: beta-propeller fold lactonase family protein [Armatimonadetes bacterium]|nr:beta-propeller fold lactonase family protein [Armatimonadota bacterium]
MKLVFSLLLALGLAGMSVCQEPQVGPVEGGGHIVPTLQRIRPAGQSVEMGGRPVDLTLSPDGKTVYIKDDRGLVVVDAESWQMRQELPFKEGGGSMHGIAASRDGKFVYLTAAGNHLWEGRVLSGGKVEWARGIVLPGPGGEGSAHGCGIALTPDGKGAYVCLSRNNSLGYVDLESGALKKEIKAGVAPFDVVLSPDGRTAYVSNWGGRHPKKGEKTAKSSGTDTLVDDRGVAASGSVSLIDLAKGEEAGQVATGLHPADMELSADGAMLYVANANSDTVSVIDTAAWKVAETIPVRPDARLPFGSASNALALSRDGSTLFVANGGNNAVAVVSLRKGSRGESAVRGFIPTGWYPGGVAADGRNLYIVNVKGVGSRRKSPQERGWHVYWSLGTAGRVALPDARTLRRYTAQVRADARVPQILRAWEKSATGKKPVPVPARTGEPSVFEHVVYIIKENRTYDQILGDLEKGNRDPALCIFGREVTPNHHALAEQFVLLDNFYCNGVNSADGHSWATEGNVTDHLEKSFGGFTRSYTFGDDPLTYSSSGFIWDNVLLHGLSFRNYGEMDYAEPVPAGSSFEAIYRDYIQKTGRITFTQSIGIETLRRYSCRDYPGWNMDIPDVLRADVFLKELKECDIKGEWPDFLIVYLPSDHTSGTSPGSPTPRARVADNDLALGRVVEAISKSRFWPKTCIFVVEDDPQAGFDHVDGHRSISLVISPYTRRGAVVSRFYNQTSVLHTMERILGLPPMNQMDAMSPLMSECFTDVPDFRPYASLHNRVVLDEMNPKLSDLQGKLLDWAKKSLAEPFQKFDEADEDTLNRILWHAVKGVDVPYPAHLAGAHGSGLKALGLKLEAEEED